MSIEELVLNYREFLLASWPYLSRILDHLDWDKEPYFLDDWAQANWELLVEGRIGDDRRLVPYGFNKSPDARYWSKGVEATDQIVCLGKNQQTDLEYRFLCFATLNNAGNYEISPPFDYVNVMNSVTRKHEVLQLANVMFGIKKLL